MQIIVFGLRFENGTWKKWIHTCDEDEIRALVDSAHASTVVHTWFRKPPVADYLNGARYIFNVARGTSAKPAEGDTDVCGVKVDKLVIGRIDGFEYSYEQ